MISKSSRAKASKASKKQSSLSSNTVERGVWSAQEHDRFLAGLKMFPEGPWKSIAEQVGTRSARQVQTHAQKYYEKVARRLRGLRKDRKKLARPEHRLDEDMVKLCKVAESSSSNGDESSGARCTAGPVVRRGLNPVVGLPVRIAVSSPAGVDAPVEDIDIDTMEPRARADSMDSIDSLLEEDEELSELEDVELSDAAAMTDSDDSDSLLDFDGYCLDYLIEILGEPTVATATMAMTMTLSDCMVSNDDSEIICAL